MLTPCESATGTLVLRFGKLIHLPHAVAESWNQGTWWEIKDIEPTQHTKYHLYHLPELVSALGSLWPPPTIEQWDVLKPFLLEHVKILRRRQVVSGGHFRFSPSLSELTRLLHTACHPRAILGGYDLREKGRNIPATRPVSRSVPLTHERYIESRLRQYEELRQSCVSLDLADTEGLMSPGARGKMLQFK